MATRRKVEIFSAGCPLCDDAVELVQEMSCPSCEISVLDMNEEKIAGLAKELGIHSVPAVTVDGKLPDCCAGKGVDKSELRAMGIGIE